jgi:predicted metal-dependent peptidase
MANALKDPASWFAAARIKATQLMPYFSAAVMGLVPHQTPGLKTMAVTKRGVLLWDPALSAVWSVEEAAWTLLHEACHWVRTHLQRAEQVGATAQPDLAKLWNYAADAEIDDDLVAAGAKYPRVDGKFIHEDLAGQSIHYQVLPGDFGQPEGRLAEEYYAALRRKAPPQGKAGMAQRQPGDGKPQSGKGKGAPGEGDVVVPHGGCAGCGSGAGNKAGELEDSVPAELGKSSAEQKRVQRAVAEAVRKHTASKGRGSVPAGLQRWAEEVLGPPQVPWQQELARVVRNAIAYRPGAGDYRYDRPSRRQGAIGYGSGKPVFPALRMPIPAVAVIQDTSGSMGDDSIKEGLQEVKGILAAVGAEVAFYACDADVHAAVRIRNVKEAAAAMKGGGGTDMKPAIDAACKAARRPEVLVICTDGHIGDPGPEPMRMNTIWLVCGAGANEAPAKWGKVVVLKSASGG